MSNTVELTDSQVFFIRQAIQTELANLNIMGRKDDLIELQINNIAIGKDIALSILEALKYN
jgi:hypothetical protein